MISPVTDKKKVNWVFYTVFTGVTIYYLVRQHSFVLKHETQFSDACHAPLACSLTLCVLAQILSWTGVWAFSRMLPEACTPAGPCRPQQLYTFNFSYLKPSWFGSTIEVLPLLALLTNFPLLGNARSRQGAFAPACSRTHPVAHTYPAAITLRDNLIVLFKLVAQTIQQRNDKEHGRWCNESVHGAAAADWWVGL